MYGYQEIYNLIKSKCEQEKVDPVYMLTCFFMQLVGDGSLQGMAADMKSADNKGNAHLEIESTRQFLVQYGVDVPQPTSLLAAISQAIQKAQFMFQVNLANVKTPATPPTPQAQAQFQAYLGSKKATDAMQFIIRDILNDSEKHMVAAKLWIEETMKKMNEPKEPPADPPPSDPKS